MNNLGSFANPFVFIGIGISMIIIYFTIKNFSSGGSQAAASSGDGGEDQKGALKARLEALGEDNLKNIRKHFDIKKPDEDGEEALIKKIIKKADLDKLIEYLDEKYPVPVGSAPEWSKIIFIVVLGLLSAGLGWANWYFAQMYFAFAPFLAGSIPPVAAASICFFMFREDFTLQKFLIPNVILTGLVTFAVIFSTAGARNAVFEHISAKYPRLFNNRAVASLFYLGDGAGSSSSEGLTVRDMKVFMNWFREHATPESLQQLEALYKEVRQNGEESKAFQVFVATVDEFIPEGEIENDPRFKTGRGLSQTERQDKEGSNVKKGTGGSRKERENSENDESDEKEKFGTIIPEDVQVEIDCQNVGMTPTSIMGSMVNFSPKAYTCAKDNLGKVGLTLLELFGKKFLSIQHVSKETQYLVWSYSPDIRRWPTLAEILFIETEECIFADDLLPTSINYQTLQQHINECLETYRPTYR